MSYNIIVLVVEMGGNAEKQAVFQRNVFLQTSSNVESERVLAGLACIRKGAGLYSCQGQQHQHTRTLGRKAVSGRALYVHTHRE